MKTTLSLLKKIKYTVLTGMILIACSDNEVAPSRPYNQDNTQVVQGGSSADELRKFPGISQSCKPDGPNYNLNVWLLGADHGEVGFIAFRQKPNESQLIHLDTRIMGLEPNTSYLLQRAVDTTLDGNCTSTSWLTLGKGLDPQSIVTNKHGFGREELFRSVSTIPVGTTFDIHFQIVKESTMEVVLTSDCYEYTVR